MKWLLLPFALLALFVLPATVPAEEEAPAEPKIDILNVTPADLGAVDAEGLVRTAHEAYAEKRYEDAARTFIMALRAQPSDSGSLYNLACCYGLLGHAGQAAAFLEAAWKAGFRDYGHIAGDGDFERVRESEEMKAVMVRLKEDAEKRKNLAGKWVPVASPVLADVRVLTPETELSPWERLPLVIGLHGLGDNGESFARLFSRRGLPPKFLYCVAQAPYAFSLGTRVGYSWSLRGPQVTAAAGNRSHELATRYVLDVLEAVKREYRVDERNVFLMGFSQGAGMTFSVAMRHPDKFRGAIPIGGWLDTGEFSSEQVRSAREHGLFLVCHSPEDRVVSYDSCRTATEFLTENGIAHRRLEYKGGHTLPADLMERVVEWIADPTAERKLVLTEEK